MARRDVLMRILGDPDDGKNAIREVLREVEGFDGTEASARLILRKQGIEEQIEKVRKRLANLSQQEATPKVKLAMARAVEQIDRLELKLDKLDTKDVEVNVDIDRGGSLRRVAGIFSSIDRSVDHSFRRIPFLGGLLSAPIKVARVALSALTTGLEVVPRLFASIAQGAVSAFGVVTETARGLISGSTSITSVLGSAGSGLVSLATGGAAAAVAIAVLVAVLGAFTVALNAVLAAVVAVAGALVALVASLAAAAAGFAAIGIAAAAAFGPALLVGIALIQRIAAVVLARRAREQELTQAVQDQKTAEQQRKAALDASRQAHEQLADATVAGRKAMAQAAIDERNAELGLEASQLGVRRSRLGLAQARRDLRELLKEAGAAGPELSQLVKRFSDVDFNPANAGALLEGAGGTGKIDPLELRDKILSVQEAQLGVRQAVERTSEAERNLSQAQKTRLDFAQRGINAYKPYRQALERVAQAEDRLRRTQDRVSAAHTKYQQKLKELSNTERGFLAALDPFIEKLKTLAQIATAPIFKGLEAAMTSLQRLFTDPALQAGLRLIGEAIGQFFASLGRQISTERWRSALAGFARDAAFFIGKGGEAFGHLLEILRIIAQTAMPELRRILTDVSGWLGRIAGQPHRIRSAVETVVDQFRVWARFAGAVARLVINLFGAAAPQGKSLAVSMTRIVNRWADWLKANPEKVRKFFRDAVEKTKEIVRQIARVVVWLRDNLPKAAATASTAFRGLAKIASGIYHTFKVLVDLLNGDLKSALDDLLHKDAKNLLRSVGEKLPGPVGDALRADKRNREIRRRRDQDNDNSDAKGDALDTLKDPSGALGRLNQRRRATASAIAGALPSLGHLVSPPLALAGSAATESADRAAVGGNHFHAHITVPGGGSPDERSMLAKISREAQKAGLVG